MLERMRASFSVELVAACPDDLEVTFRVGAVHEVSVYRRHAKRSTSGIEEKTLLVPSPSGADFTLRVVGRMRRYLDSIGGSIQMSSSLPSCKGS